MTAEVYDVLLTAMGKRRHPLLLSITTATGNSTGIGKQLLDYASRVLDGTQEDKRLFALIHAADPEDDPSEEATWIKANPSWAKPSSRTPSAPSCARPGTTRPRKRRPRRGT